MEKTKIHGNYISDINPSPFWGTNPIAGIYLDNGSKHKTVENNVIESCLMNFYALNQPVEENIFQNNYVFYKNEIKVATGNTYKNNTIINLNKDLWPEEAKAIVKNAGITEEYRDIKPKQ